MVIEKVVSAMFKLFGKIKSLEEHSVKVIQIHQITSNFIIFLVDIWIILFQVSLFRKYNFMNFCLLTLTNIIWEDKKKKQKKLGKKVAKFMMQKYGLEEGCPNLIN